MEIAPDVAENYRQLRDERGVTWEQLAAQIDTTGDGNLAAWLREQSAAEAPQRAPRGRARTNQGDA